MAGLDPAIRDFSRRCAENADGRIKSGHDGRRGTSRSRLQGWVMADLDGTTFLTGANAGFIAGLYARFLEDPHSVDEGWRRFFSEMNDDVAAVLTEMRGPSWARHETPMIGNGAAVAREADEEAL